MGFWFISFHYFLSPTNKVSSHTLTASSLGSHVIIINPQRALSLREEAHIRHGLLHLHVSRPLAQGFEAARPHRGELKAGAKVELDVGRLVEARAGVVLPGIDVREGHAQALPVEKVGDLGAGQRLKLLEVLLLAVLLLVVKMRLKFDERFVL